MESTEEQRSKNWRILCSTESILQLKCDSILQLKYASLLYSINLCSSLDSTGEYTTRTYVRILPLSHKCVQTDIMPAKYQFNTKLKENFLFRLKMMFLWASYEKMCIRIRTKMARIPNTALN